MYAVCHFLVISTDTVFRGRPTGAQGFSIFRVNGLVKLLGKNSLKHGISVRITEDNKIRLNFHVIVAYGVNISTIADNLVSNVKYKVEAFTGMEIDKIDIYVEGVRAID